MFWTIVDFSCVANSKSDFRGAGCVKNKAMVLNARITIYYFSSRLSLAGVITISTSATWQHITKKVNKQLGKGTVAMAHQHSSVPR
jgi:hypothetical protein